MCYILDKIGENLDVIQANLDKLKGNVAVSTTDKDYHIGEIYTHIERIRYHLLQINSVIKESENNVDSSDVSEITIKERSSKNMEKSCGDIAAEIIENQVETMTVKINYRDKKMRKASSWKYLTKWESILEEQWNQQNENKGEYDFTGINLIVPKRNHSFRRKNKHNISSTKEDFLDDKYLKKSNSAECILDRDDYNDEEIFSSLEKKCSSEGDLLRDSLDLSNPLDGFYNCNYLLSLKDLERIGNVDEVSKKKKKELSKETSKSCNQIRGDKTTSLHKPKIVGVIYKMRL